MQDDFYDSEKVRSKADEAWKETLSVYFQSFMQLCWPNVYNKINWQKGYEFLEQELQSITEYPSPLGKRLVDKLVKVWEKNGSEAWVLLHIEIQGDKKNNFLERLFIYRYRLFDRYRRPVATLVVLTDDNKNWRPNFYKTEFWGSSTIMSFSILKLIDFKNEKANLEKSNNPFAIIVLVQLSILEDMADSTKRYEKRYENKLRFTRLLLQKGMVGKDIRQIYKFLTGIMVMPKEYNIQYLNEAKKIEEEYKVSYLTLAEELGLERGIKVGLEKGLQQGLHDGKETLLSFLIQKKFGHLPKNYQELLHKADDNTLIKWGEKFVTANALEEIFD